ncbi:MULTISPECIES: hydroxymethylglutaryl-CoA synthase family protein [Sandaracinus]|uniref:hydroxymethylglutaryl-CoA synthase family protein n=1 Tax=Sandaracinus TaxID=1055688 RepID=UPI0019D41F56|nr:MULTISPECIES: hydroxymethylglutaryl-CoA synthase [Sandaracinus]QRN75761.1 hydroxymethylglutaryl-CoA synthase [Sandaracinus sp.]UJR87261.1 Acetyl-S-AcpK beta-ketothioester bacillaene intermediate transferase [Sandaracinus amylolyticus]
MSVGIEAMNLYAGSTRLDVRTLFEARGLDLDRFANLMMRGKSVALPWEDAVTHAANAAKPLIDRLPPSERDRIEMVITATESGLDFGKSLATYVHAHLGLRRSCRLFEIKQACYGGTAALQMAASWVASGVSPGAKALVIATDAARPAIRLSYMEPSQGTGAVAMLVGDRPDVLALDLGASGTCSYEVMDTFRPRPDEETGDADLSLLSYLECLVHAYRAYAERVEGTDLRTTFDHLAFHTPFGGMIRGAHRKLLRGEGARGEEIERDFERRVLPSMRFNVEIGNLYSASLYAALAALVDGLAGSALPARVGLFSYGSGCASEFFSGTIPGRASEVIAPMRIGDALASRAPISMSQYERILEATAALPFGTEDGEPDAQGLEALYEQTFARRPLLRLRGIRRFHREYEWGR